MGTVPTSHQALPFLIMLLTFDATSQTSTRCNYDRNNPGAIGIPSLRQICISGIQSQQGPCYLVLTSAKSVCITCN